MRTFWSRLVLGCLGSACQWPLDAEEYRVADDAADLALSVSRSSASCFDCVVDSCAGELDGCLEEAGCEELVHCYEAQANPAAEPRCGAKLEPSTEAGRAARSLLSCRYRCHRACDSGRDFACAGTYSWPHPKSETVVLQQRLYNASDQSPVSRARVDACPVGKACETPLASVTTDASGNYRMLLKIPPVTSTTIGWRGFRRIAKEGLPVFRHQLNMPIVGDREEETMLLTDTQARTVFEYYSTREGWGTVLFQVFDCTSKGADGATVQVTTANEETVVGYYDPDTPLGSSLTATSTPGDGAGIVIGLASDTWHTFVAKMDGVTVSRAEVYVPRDEIVLLGLFPEGIQ